MAFLGIALPALAVALALRRWFAPLPWSVVAIAFALTVAFVPVFHKRIPVPVDEVMRGYPYRGVFGAVESRNPLTNDTVKQILPWMQVAREELRHFRAPLWNRYQFSGYPLLGNGQSAPFSPLFLSTLFVPLPQQLVAMAGLKIFLALLFGWLFLRDEGMSSTAALFGSAIFAFSVFQTVYLYYPMTTVTALLPAAAFALRGCVRFTERRWMVLLAVVTASVASGGHPESAVHIGIACAILLLLEWRNPTRAIVAALFGVALSAPAWVPVVEQALLSVRAMALATAPHAAMNPLIAWTLLNPDGFGNPARGNWQWIYNYSIVASSYLGLLTLALLPSVRKRREVLLLAICVLLFLVAMNWTFLGRALNAIPPLSLIAQDRLRFVIVFFAAIIAARVVEGPRRVLMLPVLAAGAWLLYAKWGVTLGWASAAGVLAVLAFLLTNKPYVACVAVLVELFAFNAGFNALTNRAYYKPSLPILQRLQELTKGEPVRIAGHDWTLLPNAASQYGLEDVRGHDPMALASYARFFETVAAHDPSSDVKRVQDADHPALAFLNVRFLIADPGFTASPLWIQRYAGPDGNLYERKEWRRRFFAPRGDARIGAIAQESPTRLRVEIDAPREAFIASSQVFAPGWGVEGALSTVRLHDAFVGFRVAPGRHTVTLHYAPRSFYWSCVVAALALYIGVHAIQVDRRRRASDARRVRSGVHP
ncbi:MAG TPA: hypothetical protein VEK11_20520 [Thermoanaerobaculia bacterium]|nr:hypothetical protein [Thermoanaerobaculia bacterium]